jgi:hypothetical protein
MSEISNNPLFQFLYWFLNTPTIGGFMVAMLGGGMLTVFYLVLRWISNGGKVPDKVVYTYPTEALHHHHD